eukprot:629672-Rhodomonas_salina.3
MAAYNKSVSGIALGCSQADIAVDTMSVTGSHAHRKLTPSPPKPFHISPPFHFPSTTYTQHPGRQHCTSHSERVRR